jgi:hypothetical protein
MKRGGAYLNLSNIDFSLQIATVWTNDYTPEQYTVHCSVSLFGLTWQHLICLTASQAGHQAEADSPVRPGEECGPPPDRAVDAGQPVQW